MERPKATIATFNEKKKSGRKITMLTAYDYGTAAMIDQAGVDSILVGDSLGMVMLGYPSTVPVTMDEMIHHARAVSRAVKSAFVIGDMPFMSYQVSPEQAVANAGRFIKDAGCEAVKLEGGEEQAETVARVVRAGIPVCAHIGLTPQTATQLSGFKVQGKDAAAARRQLEAAIALEEAGAFMIVLECIPDALAARISREISIPTIGIGAGPDCDGQVLVSHDLLGLYEKFVPKFVKQYDRLAPRIKEAFTSYVRDVEGGAFPAEEHCFHMPEEELKKLDA